MANALRANLRRGVLNPGLATNAHTEFLGLNVRLYDYYVFAPRIWQLRENVTPYDAWYVALAEYLEEPLATLDVNLMRSPGPRCQFLTYEA